MRPSPQRAPRWLFLVALLAGGVGCAESRVLETPRYTLTIPSHWEVKHVAAAEGERTDIIVRPYGDAVIDSGSGATTPASANYDARTADFEAFVWAWPDSSSPVNPSLEAANRLADDPTLSLRTHGPLPDMPRECCVYRRTFRHLDRDVVPLDLVRRPGWRVIVAGVRGQGSLVGVAMRVEVEPVDVNRNCHNLRIMQVNVQDLLDGLKLHPPAAAAPAATPAAPAPSPAAPAGP